MTSEIEHIPIFTKSLQRPSPNINNKGPSDEKIRKAIKKLKYNRAANDIETEFLFGNSLLSTEFNNKFLYSMKEKNLTSISVAYHALMHYGDRKELQEVHLYRST